MVLGASNRADYVIYRCNTHSDCTARVTISADKVEAAVTESVCKALSDVEGQASAKSPPCSARYACTSLIVAPLARILNALTTTGASPLGASTPSSPR
jgi:hypothetical protein